MNLLRTLRYRLRALFRRGDLEREMDDELSFHLEMEAREHARDGAAPDEARRRATLAFGGRERIREEMRDARGWSWLEDTLRDIRVGARTLRRSPGFAIVSATTLAAAVGVNAVTFSLANGILFKPVLPAGSSPAVHVFAVDPSSRRPAGGLTLDDLAMLAQEREVFSGVAGWVPSDSLYGLSRPDLRRGFVAYVTADYFGVCAVRPALGRFFAPEEADDGARVAVISHGLWLRLGGDGALVGRDILVDGEVRTIVGVAPAGFAGPLPMFTPEVWMPGPRALLRPANAAPFRQVVARLRPGLGLSEARARLAPLGARLAPLDVGAPSRELAIETLSRFGMPGYPGAAVALRAVAGLIAALSAIVLVVAGLNLANLQLARGTMRAHELGVRLALGSSRGRLARLVFAEGLLPAAAGTLLGLAGSGWIATALGRWLTAVFEQRSLTMALDFAPDWRVATATAVYGLVVTLFASGLPALRIARGNVAERLRRTSAEPRRAGVIGRFFAGKNILVQIQVACALALLYAAGLIHGLSQRSSRLDPGFAAQGLLVAEFDYGAAGRTAASAASPMSDRHAHETARLEVRQAIRRHQAELLVRAAAGPGVARAALATSLPFVDRDGGTRRLQAADHAAEPGARPVRAVLTSVSAGYLGTLGIPVVRGRDFAPEDDERAVAVIDDISAGILFPGTEPIGRRVAFVDSTGLARRPYEVVGVVRSPRSNPFGNPPARVYLPLGTALAAGERDAENFVVLHVRLDAAAGAEAALARLQAGACAIDPDIRPRSLSSARDALARHSAFRMLGLGTILFGTLGGIALLLAVAGVFAVKSFMVARRTREFGVRIALGAGGAEIARLVLRQAVGQLACALAGGSVLALLAGLGLSRTLPAVAVFDPAILAGSAMILGAVALVACLFPALRATRVDPVSALRAE